MRALPSTCGMIFRRKFGAESDTLAGHGASVVSSSPRQSARALESKELIADCYRLRASRIETLGFSLRVAPRAAPALRPPPLRDDPSGLNLWPTRNRYLDLLLLMEFNETTRTSTAIFGGSQPLRQSTEWRYRVVVAIALALLLSSCAGPPEQKGCFRTNGPWIRVLARWSQWAAPQGWAGN